MFKSRLFWRIFGSYAVLTLVATVVFLGILASAQQEFVVEQLEQRLHDSAVVLRNDMSGIFLEGTRPELQRTLKDLSQANNTRITLVADDGTVIGDSAEDPQSMDNHRSREELQAARIAGYGVSQRPSPTLGIPMMYYALRVGDAENPIGFVRVALTMEDVNEHVASVQRLVWVTAAGVGLAALAISFLIVARIIRPLQTLTAAAHTISDGDLTRRVDAVGRDELGALAGAFNSMTDQLAIRIDQFQRNRKELEERGKLLRTVLGTMIEGVVAVDDRQCVLFANEAARPLLDVDAPDLVGRPIWEIARHSTIQKVIQSVLVDEPQKRVEVELPRPQCVVSLSATRLPGDPCPGVVLVAHDVTELRRLETVRRDFVSNVSHELKTPLTSIQAYTETLLNGAIDDPEHNHEFLERIEQQADRLHALILDLLSLAQIESDEAAFHVRGVRIAGAVSACAREHGAIAESKGVNLIAQPLDVDVCVLADEEGIRTILNNLVNNAIKYTPAGGSVTIRADMHDAQARIQVIDTGVGIPEEHQDRIFERFYRVDEARSRKLGGTGLGLSIVKHLAQLFGGRVEVASEFGRGSTFTVILPPAESVR